MGIIRNIGLLILLAIFSAGGYFVRDVINVYKERDAFRDTPELASLPETIRVRLEAQEKDLKRLRSSQTQDQKQYEKRVENLEKELAQVKEVNTKYFESLTACEAEQKEEDKQAQSAAINSPIFSAEPAVETDEKEEPTPTDENEEPTTDTTATVEVEEKTEETPEEESKTKNPFEVLFDSTVTNETPDQP